MQGTLFAADEQELQYMTFRRSVDGMLQAHGQWDDRKGGIAPRNGLGSQTSSGRTPLQSQGVKKISLADYKNRDKIKIANGDTPASQPGQKPEDTNRKQSGTETKDVKNEDPPKMKSDDQPGLGKGVEESQQTRTVDKKRYVQTPIQLIFYSSELTKSSSADTSIASDRSAAIELSSINPPAKKPRTFANGTSPVSERAPVEGNHTSQLEISKTKPTAAPTRQPHSQSAPDPVSESKAPRRATISSDPELQVPAPKDESKRSSDLPPMLSPTLPNIKSYRLPPLLSPTLPPEIEAAIAEAKPNRPRSNRSLTATNHAPSNSIPGHQPKSDTATSNGQASSSGAAKSSSPVPVTVQKQHKSRLASSTPQVDSVHQVHSKEPKKLTLWVTLKIKKKHRRELSQYLRLKPTPTKSHWRKHNPPKHRNVEDRSAAPASTNSKRERPHVSEEDCRPHIKRRRGSDTTVHRVETPGLPVSSSPPSNSASAQKSRLGPPSGLPLGNAMRRAGSGQGPAATPPRVSRHSTPSTVERGSPLRQELKTEYRAESTRLVNLARGLKHDSDKYLKLENASEEQQKLGVIIATESVLCFMLAAVVYDEPSRQDGHAGNTAQWRSILPLLRILTERSRPYQHIYGLLQQLEGVMRDTMHHYDLITMRSMFRDYEKLEASTEQQAVLQKHHVLLKEACENEIKASSAWREGHTALWVKELQSAFPRTWGQARRFPGRGKGIDAVNLKDYAKDGFALPMGSLTSGLEAVNFGLNLLKEHCEKENIQWRPKLVF